MIGAMTRPRQLAWALCILGLAVVGVVIFVEADVPDEDLTSSIFYSIAFIASPWLIFAAFCRRWKSDIGVIAAGVLLLAFELLVYRDVFINPTSSTAGLAYVSKPFIQLLALLPLGLGLGWLGDRGAAETEDGPQ